MRSTLLTTGLTAGLLFVPTAAWAADGDPTPSAEPTPEVTAYADPTEEPTPEPTETFGGTCGTPGPDGVDPCIFATGGGAPQEAGGAQTQGELPLTGPHTPALLALGLGLLLVGGTTVVVARRPA